MPLVFDIVRPSVLRRVLAGKFHSPSGRGKYTLPVQIATAGGKLVLQHTTKTGYGIVPQFVLASQNGDTFGNAPNATLEVMNLSSVAVIVTVVAQQVCNQGYLHNYIQLVQPTGIGTPATEIGPFDFHYNDASGYVHVTYSSTAQLLVAVVAP